VKPDFQNASDTFKRLNPHLFADQNSGIHAMQQKPDERLPLVNAPQGEETRWHDAAVSFEITFIIYSARPCDWDGWDIKYLQDWLVKARIIPDDGWKTLSGRVRTQKVATEAEEKTEIEIRTV